MSGGELQGRVALVTGAARNIGRAIALDLADGGAYVVVATKSDRDSAEAVVREIEARGCQAIAVMADVTQPGSIKAMIDSTLSRFGRLDILVNNAAVRTEAAFETLPLAQWREIMAIALDGPFLCAQAALPALKNSGAAAIINIGGLTAYVGAQKRAHVVAAKAGLDGLTKALAHELAADNITVNLVSPGLIDTARAGAQPHHHQSRGNLLGRRGTPAEVAAMVRFLAGPGARYVTGQTLHVNGGAYLP